MTKTVYTDADGLGIAPWIIPLVGSIGASVAGALATKYIVGGSGPSQKEVEKQMKLQQQEEIRRMVQAQAERARGEETGGYLLPALGVVALVMLLR